MRVLDTDLPGIVRVAFSGDGRVLVAVGADRRLVAWDWVEGRELLRVAGCSLPPQVAVSADGERVACVAATNLTVHSTGRQPPVTLGQSPDIGGLAFSPDGKFLAASVDGELQGRSRGSSRLLRWAVGPWRSEPGFYPWPAFDRLAFGRNGELLAGINSDKFELRFTVSGGLNGWARPGAGRHGSQMHFSFSPAGDTVAYGWNNTIHFMDADSGQVVRHLSDANDPFRDAAFTADGRRLGTVGDDGTVKLWDAATGRLAEHYDWRSGPLRCLAFAPDGGCGVCGTSGGQLVFFDVDG